MSEKDLRAKSRGVWTLRDGEIPTSDQLNVGSLQRIADATEVMAKNYVEMQRSLDYYKAEHARLEERIRRLEHSRAGYKAHLTRVQNLLKARDAAPAGEQD